MDKKVPMRMCVVCRENKPKKELLRVVMTDNGLTLDTTGKLNGRGAYICDSIECINKGFKTKAFNKAFKQNISPDNYDRVKEQYLGRKQN